MHTPVWRWVRRKGRGGYLAGGPGVTIRHVHCVLLVLDRDKPGLGVRSSSVGLEQHLMPAAGKMSRASMKALPTIPNMFSTLWATIVSVKASLEVILVGVTLHAGS